MRISALPLEACLVKLSDNTTGFNARLRTCAPDYGIKPFAIAFPQTLLNNGTPSFVLGKMTPEMMAVHFPSAQTKMAMYVDQAQNQNIEKPRNFSGLVAIGIDLHLQWQLSDNSQLFEPYSLAVEDVMGDVLNLANIQNWGAGVVYNGAFSIIRGPIAVPVDGQGSYRQLVGTRLTFEVSV